MTKKPIPLTSPFVARWELEVLRAAGSSKFITIIVCPPGIDIPPNICHQVEYIPYGEFVLVGQDWLRDNLSLEGLVEYMAEKMRS